MGVTEDARLVLSDRFREEGSFYFTCEYLQRKLPHYTRQQIHDFTSRESRRNKKVERTQIGMYKLIGELVPPKPILPASTYRQRLTPKGIAPSIRKLARENPGISAKEIAERTGFSSDQILSNARHLVNRGELEEIGERKYRFVRKGPRATTLEHPLPKEREEEPSDYKLFEFVSEIDGKIIIRDEEDNYYVASKIENIVKTRDHVLVFPSFE